MCKFCEEVEILRSSNFGGSGQARIYKHGYEDKNGMLEFQGDNRVFKIFKRLYCPRFDISYCPMCGRRLGRNYDK